MAAEGEGATSSDPNNIPAPSDVAKPPADAQRTTSGLMTKLLEAGKGEIKPKPQDRVKVHYTGWTTDGKMFDSSHKRGRPTTFGVTQVIPGWTEGLQLMSIGSKYQFVIPYNLGYGERGAGGQIGPFETLIFEVELIEIKS